MVSDEHREKAGDVLFAYREKGGQIAAWGSSRSIDSDLDGPETEEDGDR
jgi:hypothetical protein